MLMEDSEFTRRTRFDMPFLGIVLLLLCIGLASIFSATRNAESDFLRHLFKAQVLWILLGIVIFGVVAYLPVRLYYGLAYVFYGVALLMLIYLEVTGGHLAKGAERWIRLGPIGIQPADYAKIGLLLALSRYLSAKSVNLENLSSLLIPGLLVAVPFAFILKQPDLGTAVILSLMILPLFYWAGMPAIQLFFLVSPIVSILLSFNVIPWGVYFLLVCILLYLSRPSLWLASLVVITNLFTAGVTALAWNLLHDYQKNRILSFLDPGLDPFGAGYQIIQSKVAIGSGRFFGKGFLHGSQTKLSFLPEQHTDFIFSVFGEQFGFLGACVLLLLFFLFIYRGLSVTKETHNRFVALLCVGAVSIIGFHIFVNLAMTIGMMPVTGTPMPFLSYGGSFVVTCMILVGLIASARRSIHDF